MCGQMVEVGHISAMCDYTSDPLLRDCSMWPSNALKRRGSARKYITYNLRYPIYFFRAFRRYEKGRGKGNKKEEKKKERIFLDAYPS